MLSSLNKKRFSTIPMKIKSACREGGLNPTYYLMRIIQSILYRFGYSLTRVQKHNVEICYTNEEVNLFNHDMRRLDKTFGTNGKWNYAARKQALLTMADVNRYCAIINLCEQHGIDFSDNDFLDVGTCSGFFLRLLKRRYPTCRLSAFELQDQYVALAKFLNPDVPILKQGIVLHETTGGKLSKVDIVLCADVIEHIICPEIAVKSLSALLRDNGKLVLVVPNGRFDNISPYNILKDGKSYQGHVNFWSPESWAYFIKGQFSGHIVSTGLFHEDRLYAIIKMN